MSLLNSSEDARDEVIADLQQQLSEHAELAQRSCDEAAALRSQLSLQVAECNHLKAIVMEAGTVGDAALSEATKRLAHETLSVQIARNEICILQTQLAHEQAQVQELKA